MTYDEPVCILCERTLTEGDCRFCARYGVEVDGHRFIADSIGDREYIAGVRIKWRILTPMGNVVTLSHARARGYVTGTWLCTCGASMPCPHPELARKAAKRWLDVESRELRPEPPRAA